MDLLWKSYDGKTINKLHYFNLLNPWIKWGSKNKQSAEFYGTP